MTETEKRELELIDQIPDENARKFVSLLYDAKPMEIPGAPEKNTWYVYHPDGAVCSDGTPYYSILRIGSENKLMVMFCGGGVALDAYSAARPNEITKEEGGDTFYSKNTAVMGYFYGKGGIAGNDREDNPFRNWSVVVIQYASGDFHCGTNDFTYDDPEKGHGICRHRGYLNYQAMLKKIKAFVPEPEQILVTGFSAGGFGTALLTDDVMHRFPQCKDVTCLADSAAFAYEGWRKTAQEQWKAPTEIISRLTTDNLTMDCLLDLHKTQGEKVKIAFACTYRDALLAQIQNYVDGKGLVFDKEGGDRIQQVLKEMVETLCKEVPSAAIYIFDKDNPEVEIGNLTDHTIIATDAAFEYSYQGHSFIEWVANAVSGKPEKIGMELLGLNM